MLKISSRPVGTDIVLDLEGRLDGGCQCEVLRHFIVREIETGNRRFVLNMQKLQWMNSVGLQCLIRAYATVRRAGGSFALSSPNHRVLGVLQVSGLVPTIFPVVVVSRDQMASSA